MRLLKVSGGWEDVVMDVGAPVNFRLDLFSLDGGEAGKVKATVKCAKLVIRCVFFLVRDALEDSVQS